MSHRTRAILLFVIVASFTVLIFGGAQIAKHKPPIPARVVAPGGEVVFTAEDIAPASASTSPAAASTSARSGATAPTWRPTGRPTPSTAPRSSRPA